MPLAQPPGIRSTVWGGVWESVTEADGRPHLQHDLPSMMGQLTPHSRAMMMEDIRAKVRMAEAGTLTYGPEGHVDQMMCVTDVLEIRLETRRTVVSEDMLVRLYFTEPASVDDLMLSLRLAWKEPGPMGLAEQNAHARHAQSRFDSWR